MNAVPLWVSASASFYGTSANSVNRSPIEAGNNQMLCPSIGACNRNNFATHSLVFSFASFCVLRCSAKHDAWCYVGDRTDDSSLSYSLPHRSRTVLHRCISPDHGRRIGWRGAPHTAYAFGGWHPHGSVNNWPVLGDERATWKGWRRMLGRWLPLAS